MSRRLFSTARRLATRPAPRFVTTLKEAAKPALQKPEPVTRPFGFAARTELAAPRWSDVFGPAARARRQRQLDHDIKHSAFYESKSFQNTGGKIFSSPVSYFRRDKAMFFPGLAAPTLAGDTRRLYDVCKDRVTVLRVFSAMSGEKCTNTYVEPYLDDAGYARLREQHPAAQIVDVNVPQSWVKGLFVALARPNLRRMVAAARHGLYFVVASRTFDADAKAVLKCDNACSGYVYVLDGDGRIRWAASGPATDAERAMLWTAVSGIEREQSGSGPGSPVL